eukprot:s3354_g8.t1
MEQARKRFKLFGNLGPCKSEAADSDDVRMVTSCSSFADAGLKLTRKTDERFWEQQISFERKAAYKKWTMSILSNPGAWSVARPKRGENLIDLMRNGISESIKDCLGVKATSTLHNRVNPLIRYAQFAKEVNVDPFPIQEPVAYQFVKSKDVAPTFPRSFITSVAFAKHVLGLLHADEVLDSCRLKGFASLHYTKKRKLVQRPALTVEQISYLERTVMDGNRTLYDRVGAGFFLFMTFGRLRFSDAQSVTQLELEIPVGAKSGYLEGSAERCKTNTSLEKKTRLLPVVVPTRGFVHDEWIIEWMECRARGNLHAGPGVPLLPSPSVNGGWSRVPLSCEAAGDWLRALLKDVPGKKSSVRLATHSCKASILSMCAKYGMQPAARRMLGYHSSGKDKSMLTYSRDSMAWPVRLLEKMHVDQLQRSLQLIQVQLDTIQALLQQQLSVQPSASTAVHASDPAVTIEEGDDIHFVFDLDPDGSAS